jgi:hypothetical protein
MSWIVSCDIMSCSEFWHYVMNYDVMLWDMALCHELWHFAFEFRYHDIMPVKYDIMLWVMTFVMNYDIMSWIVTSYCELWHYVTSYVAMNYEVMVLCPKKSKSMLKRLYSQWSWICNFDMSLFNEWDEQLLFLQIYSGIFRTWGEFYCFDSTAHVVFVCSHEIKHVSLLLFICFLL